VLEQEQDVRDATLLPCRRNRVLQAQRLSVWNDTEANAPELSGICHLLSVAGARTRQPTREPFQSTSTVPPWGTGTQLVATPRSAVRLIARSILRTPITWTRVPSTPTR